MSNEDVAKVIKWFKRRIEFIEEGPYRFRDGVREGLNRLVGFVDVLERELRDKMANR